MHWLPGHIERVLKTPGFLLAKIFRFPPEAEPDSQALTWVVQFDIESREALEAYFAGRAAEMRAETLSEFGNQIKVSRLVLVPEERVIEAH